MNPHLAFAFVCLLALVGCASNPTLPVAANYTVLTTANNRLTGTNITFQGRWIVIDGRDGRIFIPKSNTTAIIAAP